LALNESEIANPAGAVVERLSDVFLGNDRLVQLPPREEKLVDDAGSVTNRTAAGEKSVDLGQMS
jgi:hypothetical protein